MKIRYKFIQDERSLHPDEVTPWQTHKAEMVDVTLIPDNSPDGEDEMTVTLRITE